MIKRKPSVSQRILEIHDNITEKAFLCDADDRNDSPCELSVGNPFLALQLLYVGISNTSDNTHLASAEG